MLLAIFDYVTDKIAQMLYEQSAASLARKLRHECRWGIRVLPQWWARLTVLQPELNIVRAFLLITRSPPENGQLAPYGIVIADPKVTFAATPIEDGTKVQWGFHRMYTAQHNLSIFREAIRKRIR